MSVGAKFYPPSIFIDLFFKGEREKEHAKQGPTVFFFLFFPATDGSQIGMGALSGRRSAPSTPTQCFTLLIVQRVNSTCCQKKILNIEEGEELKIFKMCSICL